MKHIIRTAVIATTALSVGLVTGAPAIADVKARPLAVVKKAVTDRIDKRLAALEKFGATLGKAEKVQSAHRATLTALIGDQTSGLTALKTKVAGETTAEAVKTDAKSMVNDFRVFVLTGPKVRLTAAIDTELAVAAKLGDKGDAAEKTLAGQVDKLLAIQPGPDGDAIRDQVKPVRAAAHTARTELKK